MAASCLEMFKTSSVDEEEILKLVADHLLPPPLLHAILQWRLTKGEEIPTPNTTEIVVSKALFQLGFRIHTYNFFRGLLHHFKIELVHLNPNADLQIAIFVHLCEAYLTILPNFSLFKYYFFLKYQPSAANHQVIGRVGIQAWMNWDFLALPLKNSLKVGIPNGSTMRTTNLVWHPSLAIFPNLMGPGLNSRLMSRCQSC
jgi:hypothetical protein